MTVVQLVELEQRPSVMACAWQGDCCAPQQLTGHCRGGPPTHRPIQCASHRMLTPTQGSWCLRAVLGRVCGMSAHINQTHSSNGLEEQVVKSVGGQDLRTSTSQHWSSNRQKMRMFAYQFALTDSRDRSRTRYDSRHVAGGQ